MMNLVTKNKPTYSFEYSVNEIKNKLEKEKNNFPFKVEFFEYHGDLIVVICVLSDYVLSVLPEIKFNLTYRQGLFQQTMSLDSFTVKKNSQNSLLIYNCQNCYFDLDQVIEYSNLIIVNVESNEYLLEKGSPTEQILNLGFQVYNFNSIDCKNYIICNYDINYLKIYNSLSSCKSKTDFILFCFLLKEGGLYMNVPIKLNNLEKFLTFKKRNGIVFNHSERSSFYSLKFEKGHTFLKYLLDKLNESYYETKTTSLVLKYQTDYDDYIEKQMNLLSIVHQDEVDVGDYLIDEKENNDSVYNLFSNKLFFKRLIYTDNNLFIYENECDKLCMFKIKKIHKYNSHLIYVTNEDSNLGPVRMVLSFIRENNELVETFQFEKSIQFWINSREKINKIEYPNLQYLTFANWESLCERVAIHFYDLGMYDVAMSFCKQILYSDNDKNLYLRDDFTNIFINILESNPKYKPIMYYYLNKQLMHKNDIDVNIGKKLITFCRIEQMYKLCQLYYDKIKNLTQKNDLNLLAELEYEYIIFSAYNGNRSVGESFVYVFNSGLNYYMKENSLFNLKFYEQCLVHKDIIDISEQMNKYDGIEFRSSSCSLIRDPEGFFVLNKRFVNYEVTDDGIYKIPNRKMLNVEFESNKYISINKYIKYTHNFDLVEDKVFETEMKDIYIRQSAYVCEGIEDLKLFTYQNDIYYSGTICVDGNYNISIGKYDISKDVLEMFPTKSTENFSLRDVEKNWCFFQDFDEPYFVYKWRPLTICKFDSLDNSITNVKNTDTPPMFDFARGSCNLIKWKEDEFLGMIHIVDYNANKKRHYYHCFVTLDDKLNLKSYSFPKKFMNKEIEYCLGLTVDFENVYLSFSVNDSKSYIATYDRDYVSNLLVNENK